MTTTRFWRGATVLDPETWRLADVAYSVAPIALR
jgi:hypothetical protein